MRFLLTNDDGIDAPGLQSGCATRRRPLGELIVAAPRRRYIPAAAIA